MVEVARLNLVEWDDDSLEENDVFISEGDSKSGDDGGEDIEQLCSSVEFVVFVDESVEAISDGLSDHLSSGDKLGVESVENVLEIFSFSGFFSIEELEEFLDEGMCDENLERLDISSLVDDELEEKIVDGLEVWPGKINKNFLSIIDSSDTFIGGISLFENWEWSENIFFDHFDNQIKMGDDKGREIVGLIQYFLQLSQVLESFIFFLEMFIFVIEIVLIRAELDFLQELISELFWESFSSLISTLSSSLSRRTTCRFARSRSSI